MDRLLRITTGRSRLSQRLERKKVGWDKLSKKLTTFEPIDCTYDEYRALLPDQQAALKDVGFMVGGQFNGPRRLADKLALRSVITLDIDHIDPWDLDEITDTYADYAFAVHSTAKHSPDTPRLRLVFPLAKDIKPEKYEPVARAVANRLGMEAFDDTTFQPARIMYWPSCTINGEVYKHINEGEFINAKEILATYEDWHDFAEWPHSSRVGKIRKPVTQAEDPLSKPGVIGAFCRTYDIHSAIQTFDLPYEPTDFENRYAPEGSSGAAGAIVYDDVFLYSHHESDAAAQQNCNAFDLVRLHRFPELVAQEGDDIPMGERPSYRAMSQLAVSNPTVITELHTELVDEMEAVEIPESETPQQVNGKDTTPALGLSELLKSAAKLTPEDKTGTDKLIWELAIAKLDPFETNQVVELVKECTGTPKGVTTDAINARHKDLTKGSEAGREDSEQRVIKYFLKKHYKKGRTLKRFNGTYWTYETGLWAMESSERIDGQFADMLFKLRRDRPQDFPELVMAVDDKETSAWVRSMPKTLMGVLAKREDRDDPLQLMRTYPLPVINTTNCELWFDQHGKMEKRKHNPDHFFTMQIGCDYDPKAKCPEWDRFCELIFANSSDPEDMQRHLEELGGYVIGTTRWLKTWVLLHGPKDTGKSTFTEVLRRLLGNSFFGESLIEFSHGSSQFKNTRLVGKLAFVDDDYDAGAKLPDGFLKKISEEKALSSDRKYGEGFQFVCRALPIICSNHWPHASDITDALRERALVFPFHHRIAGSARDDTRRNAMLNELPGILNRFIAGLSRLRKRSDWDAPMDCKEAHDTFEAELNIVAKWKAECLEKDFAAQTIPKDAHQSFENWLMLQGFTRRDKFVPKRNGFYQKLDALLGERVLGHNGVKTWRGWRMTNQLAASADEMDDTGDVDDWDED